MTPEQRREAGSVLFSPTALAWITAEIDARLTERVASILAQVDMAPLIDDPDSSNFQYRMSCRFGHLFLMLPQYGGSQGITDGQKSR